MDIRSAAAAVSFAALLCSMANGAGIEEGTYNRWKTVRLKNDLLTVDVTPQLGGRLIQLRLGKHEFLWTNPLLKGQGPTKSGLGPDQSWLNYGGSKVWPAPQGWSNPEEEWPGPPDAILDGQPHQVTAAHDHGASVSLSLLSRKDPRTGIQLSKTLALEEGAAHVSFDHQMTNIGAKPRRWSIWQVTQIDARATSSSGFNSQLRAYCPANPESKFPKGYHELFGMVNNPCFRREADTGLVVSTYDYLVGKIGMDCSAGWQAVVDENAGYALVERFTYFPGEQYPDGDSTEVWMNGPGQFFAAGKVNAMESDLKKTPPFLETEILSPLKRLEPGESATFRIDWFATCTGKGSRVYDCAEGGVVCQPLSASREGGKVALRGKFGVFYSGRLELLADGAAQDAAGGGFEVSPLDPVDFGAAQFSGLSAPASAQSVVVNLVDKQGRRHKLAEAQVK